MRAYRPRPRHPHLRRSLVALWSIGMLTAVLGIASLGGAAAATTTPTSAYGSAIPPAGEPEESRADRIAPRGWLGAAFSTTSVTGAGTDRRQHPDTALPAAVDDHADHRFSATSSCSDPAHHGAPLEPSSPLLKDSRAPPSSPI